MRFLSTSVVVLLCVATTPAQSATSKAPTTTKGATTTKEARTTRPSPRNSTPAAPSYCFNGGTASCLCPPGYTGDRCQSYVNWCSGQEVYENGDATSVQLCGPHGRCDFDQSRGSFCVCNAGWTGQFCDSPIANQTFISTRCHYHYGAANPNPDCKQGHERCLPDKLNCGFEPCNDQDNIGWCVPFPTHESIMAAYLSQQNLISRHG